MILRRPETYAAELGSIKKKKGYIYISDDDGQRIEFEENMRRIVCVFYMYLFSF